MENFPKLTLAKLAKEREERDLKEDREIAEKYNIIEKDIPDTDMILNKVYDGVQVKRRSYNVNDYVIIEHDEKYYVVMRIRTESGGTVKHKPLVFDLKMLKTIRGNDNVWSLSNKYPSLKGKIPYLHNFIHNHLPEKEDKGEFSYDHLNRIRLDSRLCNFKFSNQSNQNKNKKIRRIGSKNLDRIPEPYGAYYINNRPRYIYWLYGGKHGHLIVAGPIEGIKEKKFSSNDLSKIQNLMKKLKNILLTRLKKWAVNQSNIIRIYTKC